MIWTAVDLMTRFLGLSLGNKIQTHCSKYVLPADRCIYGSATNFFFFSNAFIYAFVVCLDIGQLIRDFYPNGAWLCGFMMSL